MSYMKIFSVDIDTGQGLVTVRLDFGTKGRKLLNEAINLLVGARDKLQELEIREQEDD